MNNYKLPEIVRNINNNIEILEELLKLIEDKDPILYSDDIEETLLFHITINTSLVNKLLTQNN